MAASRATGRDLKSLTDPPEILPEFIHIWKWFNDLSGARSRGFQTDPISYTDIEAYFRLMRISAHPDEIHILKLIDQEYLAVLNKVVKEK